MEKKECVAQQGNTTEFLKVSVVMILCFASSRVELHVYMCYLF